jgi:hypothetical protein
MLIRDAKRDLDVNHDSLSRTEENNIDLSPSVTRHRIHVVVCVPHLQNSSERLEVAGVSWFETPRCAVRDCVWACLLGHFVRTVATGEKEDGALAVDIVRLARNCPHIDKLIRKNTCNSSDSPISSRDYFYSMKKKKDMITGQDSR